MSGILPFFYRQFFVTPPVPSTDFSGQTIIVTGSNTGLGKEAVQHLVRLNASKVILAVRTASKGHAAVAEIEAATGKKGACDVWPLDMGSYGSVKAFARRVEADLPRLDAVIENAGIMTETFRLREGSEETVTVNVLSTFLLALLVLPKLRDSAARFGIAPKLSITTSETHAWTSFSAKEEADVLEAMNDETKADMAARYMDSKLLECLYIRQLAPAMTDSQQGRQGKAKVILNCTSPGFCHSELASRGGQTMGMTVMKAVLARTTEVGSRTLVGSVVAGDESHGQYLCDCVPRPMSNFVLSEEGDRASRKIYDEVNAKLEKISPGILANI